MADLPTGSAPLPPMNLGLSFADATHQTGQAGAPVIFGAMAFARGTAGGIQSSADPSQSSSGSATAVTPVTALGGSGGGGDSMGGLGKLAGMMPGVTPFIENSMGLNGGMVQDPRAQAAIYKTVQPGGSVETIADDASIMPGPLALGGIALALAVGAYFLFVR